MTKEEFNQKIFEAQERYCDKHGLPNFILPNGCWYCKQSVAESIEYAETHFINGCPHCNRSFCD